jgi:hypothetical protein
MSQNIHKFTKSHCFAQEKLNRRFYLLVSAVYVPCHVDILFVGAGRDGVGEGEGDLVLREGYLEGATEQEASSRLEGPWSSSPTLMGDWLAGG